MYFEEILKLKLFFISVIISTFLLGEDCVKATDTSRITVAGGSITEILYMLDAEEKIVAVDLTSNFPPRALKLPQIGYVRALSAEGILSLEPSIILGEDDMGPPSVLNQIERTGIDIVVIPEEHSSKGIFEKINCIAKILDVSSTADKLIREKILPANKKLIKNAELVKGKNLKAIFILGLQSGSPILGGMDTSANGFIKMIGATNPMTSFEGWKPVGTEAIISSSPDIIIITNRGLNTFGDVESLKSHPALALTPAAQNNNIFALDGMAMLGFAPRSIFSALELTDDILEIDD